MIFSVLTLLRFQTLTKFFYKFYIVIVKIKNLCKIKF